MGKTLRVLLGFLAFVTLSGTASAANNLIGRTAARNAVIHGVKQYLQATGGDARQKFGRGGDRVVLLKSGPSTARAIIYDPKAGSDKKVIANPITAEVNLSKSLQPGVSRVSNVTRLFLLPKSKLSGPRVK